MAVSDPTSNYGWLLPDVNGDIGAWGGILNAIFGEDTGPPLGIDGVLKSIEDMFLALNADNLTQGTVPDGRLSGSYTGVTDITASGTITAGNASLGDKLIVAPNTVALSAGTNNDVAVGDATFIRFSHPSASTVTGIAGGEEGRLLWVANVSGTDITLADFDAGSAAANRFQFSFSADVVLSPNQVAGLIYNGASSWWELA